MTERKTAAHQLPEGVITDIDEQDPFKPFEERTDERLNIQHAAVISREDLAADAIKPMQWPMLDDGKKLSLNAYGYPTGGWYAMQEEKARQEEQARKAAQEAAARAAAEAAAAQEQEQRLTVEQIEQLRAEAREDGYQEGLKTGQQEGYAAGFKQGHDEGVQQGITEGKPQGYAAGLAQGQQEGFQQGQQQGIAEGSAVVNAQAERFRHLADMLATPLRELDRDVTDEIIYIISRLTRVILKREIHADAAFLQDAVGHGVQLLHNAKAGAILHLHPDDVALLEAAFGRDYITKANWQLTPDENLQPGDVEAENAASTVSWRVDERIDALLDDFLVKAAPAVAQAVREPLEGLPDADALPRRHLAPPPQLADFKADIAAKVQAAAMPAATGAAEVGATVRPHAATAVAVSDVSGVPGSASASSSPSASTERRSVNLAALKAAPAASQMPTESPAMAARRRAKAAAEADRQAAQADLARDELPPIQDDPFAALGANSK